MEGKSYDLLFSRRLYKHRTNVLHIIMLKSVGWMSGAAFTTRATRHLACSRKCLADGKRQLTCTSLGTITNIGNSLPINLTCAPFKIMPQQSNKIAKLQTSPSSSSTRSPLPYMKMSNHSTPEMRPPRRNAVSEIPFAGRIGGFQQEIVDDEKNREILKNQPDAVCIYYDFAVARKREQCTNAPRPPSTHSATPSTHQASSSSTTGKWP